MRQRTTTRLGPGMRITAAAAIISAAAAIAAAGIPMAAGAATAPVSTAPASKIRQVPCTSRTFNVHYGRGREKCFAGTGLEFARIPDVRKITTGSNRGWFAYEGHGVRDGVVHFGRHQTYLFSPVLRAELVAVDIA